MKDLDSSLDQFNAAVTKFCSTVPEDLVEKVVKKLAFDGLKSLVYKTPVKTGHARRGWQVATVGKAALLRSLADAAKKKEKTDPTGAATIREGLAAIEATHTFAIIDIENHVEYILALEDGGSDQAPNGMLGLTFDELTATFQG